MSDTHIVTRDMIQSKLMQGVVTHSAFDAQGRLSKVTEAPVYVKHGEPCLVTDLKYDGTTSKVKATKETVGTWDSALHFDNL